MCPRLCEKPKCNMKSERIFHKAKSVQLLSTLSNSILAIKLIACPQTTPHKLELLFLNASMLPTTKAILLSAFRGKRNHEDEEKRSNGSKYPSKKRKRDHKRNE